MDSNLIAIQCEHCHIHTHGTLSEGLQHHFCSSSPQESYNQVDTPKGLPTAPTGLPVSATERDGKSPADDRSDREQMKGRTYTPQSPRAINGDGSLSLADLFAELEEAAIISKAPFGFVQKELIKQYLALSSPHSLVGVTEAQEPHKLQAGRFNSSTSDFLLATAARLNRWKRGNEAYPNALAILSIQIGQFIADLQEQRAWFEKIIEEIKPSVVPSLHKRLAQIDAALKEVGS